jgi:predicted RNA-binding Zn-ribbon protein involved in translation (DUF1610 family)
VFFFVGGIQPKTIDLGKQSSPCPSCGLYQTRLKRVDHYISIFFLPVIRIKKGEVFLFCERCEISNQAVDESFRNYKQSQNNHCSHCGRLIEQTYNYCPSCGEKL